MNAGPGNMRKAPPILVLILAGLACCLAFSTVFAAMFRDLTTPKPISKTNVPDYFYVIGFDKSGKPVALLHEISDVLAGSRKYYESRAEFKREESKNWGPCLWKEDLLLRKPYKFYIPQGRVKGIEMAVNESVGPLKKVRLSLITSDASARSQIVRLNYINDDFSYHCIYSVDHGDVRPIGYGDCKKRDAFAAFQLAAGAAALVASLAVVSLLMWSRARETGK